MARFTCFPFLCSCVTTAKLLNYSIKGKQQHSVQKNQTLYVITAIDFYFAIYTIYNIYNNYYRYAAAKSLESCPTLCNPIDGSSPGSPILGFSRQEHWGGLPFPSPMLKVKSESEDAQSCPTLSNPMDHSLSGSSVHGILLARKLESYYRYNNLYIFIIIAIDFTLIGSYY